LPTTQRPVRQAALAEVKDDLSRFLRLAESEEILITRHGKPARSVDRIRN
jgi:antitoxin (DNA-binding transcriptional repressor) of toxin-antitoxin stability system